MRREDRPLELLVDQPRRLSPRVGQELSHFRDCGNLAGQVQMHSPQKLGIVSRRGRFKAGLLPALGQAPVDFGRDLSGLC